MIDSKGLVSAVVRNLVDKKAEDIVVLEISRVSLIADYFVVCTCRSGPHMNSVNDAVAEAASDAGSPYYRREGSVEGGWVLHDLSSVIVHAFLPSKREFYDIERLWRDGVQLDVDALASEAEKGETRVGEVGAGDPGSRRGGAEASSHSVHAEQTDGGDTA